MASWDGKLLMASFCTMHKYIYIHTMILYRSVFFLTFKCFFHETMNLVVGGFIVHNLSFRGAAVFSFFGDTSSY